MIKIHFNDGTYTIIEGEYKEIERDLLEAVKVFENTSMLPLISFTRDKKIINLDNITYIEEENKDENN